ncbi:MAG TPA: AmmeMemoRadiSam system protein A [Bacteroidota bacterium]|jgi:AmmeMemoRadiSam system protein A|nr:AmmeMemoRadiSam system protein A [Bacteroidota bacterium]
MLSDSEKQMLLKIARQTIDAAINGRDVPKAAITQPALLEHAGAFVTLHENFELRGCIGYADPSHPLFETVRDAAEKAALQDPRFMPVSRDELPCIEIEISVLSPLTEMTSLDEIEIGKHGLVVELGDHRGLLLPQVAIQAGWDKETYLRQTMRKSGLPPHLWHDRELKVYWFTAEVFGEPPPSLPEHDPANT